MASNIRALVSNLGDGNWGVTGTPSADDNLINAAVTASVDKSIYFPPGASKLVAPVPGADTMSPAASSAGLIGWTSKTQWMVQLVVANLGTGGTPKVTVSAVRPTGVEEEVLSVTATGSHSYGGFEDEAIVGPVAYFKFTTDSTGGSADIRCYVIGWNYGDISDGFAR
jgi:hypothetical protein